MASYPDAEHGLHILALAILNSNIASFITNQLNPTIHYGAREIGDLPVPPVLSIAASVIKCHVEQAVALARTESEGDETTYDFIAPAYWSTGIEDIAALHSNLTEIERLINEEIYKLYQISDKDRVIIESEYSQPSVTDLDDDGGDQQTPSEELIEEVNADSVRLTCDHLARQWISYAIGIVMGRFQPGIGGALVLQRGFTPVG